MAPLYRGTLLMVGVCMEFVVTLSQSPTQTRLTLEDVLTGNYHYNPAVAPTSVNQFGRNTTIITLRMRILSIDIADSHNVPHFIVDFVSEESWNDPRLRHHVTNAKGYSIPAPYAHIWLPNTHFLDSYTENALENVPSRYMLRVYADGGVRLIVRIQHRFRCSMNFDRYPWDRHLCAMKLASFENLVAVNSHESSAEYVWSSDNWFSPSISSDDWGVSASQSKACQLKIADSASRIGDGACLQVDLAFWRLDAAKRWPAFFLAPAAFVLMSFAVFLFPQWHLCSPLMFFLFILHLLFTESVNISFPMARFSTFVGNFHLACSSMLFTEAMVVLLAHIALSCKGARCTRLRHKLGNSTKDRAESIVLHTVDDEEGADKQRLLISTTGVQAAANDVQECRLSFALRCGTLAIFLCCFTLICIAVKASIAKTEELVRLDQL